MSTYSAYILTERSRRRLLDRIPPKYENVVADHITYSLKSSTSPPKPGKVVVIGVVDDGHIQAAIVEIDGEIERPDGKVYHITISHDDKRKPKDSNTAILKGRIKKIRPFEIDVVPAQIKHEQRTTDMSKEEVLASKWFAELDRRGEVYFVGGSVRDELLGKAAKDIDVVVRGIDMDTLKLILAKYGKVTVNQVGGRQVVIKFVPLGTNKEVDIALPRTERKVGAGHKGFEIQADPNLPIIKDLERRDFTINAIAKDAQGNIIDPFGGMEDLKRKIIRAVNPNAFIEDPLRMLRAVQFAARLGFRIEPETARLIKRNAPLLREITPERILIELDKMVKKGDASIGMRYIRDLGLDKYIFGYKIKQLDPRLSKVTSVAELFALYPPENIETYARGGLKKSDLKLIEALTLLLDDHLDIGELRWRASKALKITPDVVDSQILSSKAKRALKDVLTRYPLTHKDLDITPQDLMEMGFRGKEIGEALNLILRAIYKDIIDNDREQIIAFINDQLF